MPRLRNETRDMEFRDLRDEAGDGTHQEKTQQLSNFRCGPSDRARCSHLSHQAGSSSNEKDKSNADICPLI